MELILLRHTRVDLPQGICYGASDLGLAADRDHAFASIDRLLPRSWTRIVSSPLRRCRELAEHLVDEEPLSFDARLQEMDFGLWELQAWDTIPEAEHTIWGADWVNVPPPAGESLAQMARRVQAALREIIEAGEDTLIVSHGGPIRAMLSHLFSLTLREGTILPIDRGHHYHMRREGSTWTALAENIGHGD